MTTPQGQSRFPHWPALSRLMFLLACTGVAWFFGGFAALALGRAVA